MSTLRELGAQLRAGRQARGESQATTAAALGVTRQWLARVESGTGNPDLRQLFGLCNHLGLHLSAVASPAQAAADPPSTENPGPTVPAQFKPRPGAAPEVDLDLLLATFSEAGAGAQPMTPWPSTPTTEQAARG
jgi:transcriptional regulator with XRE-family HTH domain